MIEGEDVCEFCGEKQFDEFWGPRCCATGWCGQEVVALKAERDRLKSALEVARMHMIRLLADDGIPSEDWGRIDWQRDIDAALRPYPKSNQEGK